jgi:hypothetical protein
MSTPDIAACLASAARILAVASAAREDLADAEGPGAVAQKAHYPGHRLGSPEGIAARYEQMAASAERAA